MTFRPTTEAPVWADNQRTPGSNWFFGMGFLSPQLSTVSLNFNSAGQGLVTGTEEVVAPPPRKIRFTGPVAPFSTSMVGYEMYRRSYPWDGAYNISRMNDTYPMSLAPGDVGEVELELMTDPDSIPTVDTPG